MITDGYTLFTDQYMGTVLSGDANVTSALLLNLPEFQPGSMYVSAQELHLSSSVTDPNILMHAALLQYWHMLSLKAAAYDVDFTMQAFVKFLSRVLRNPSEAELASIFVAKLDAVYDYASNGSLVIDTQVPAKQGMHQFRLVRHKPAKLTEQVLPSEDFSDGSTGFIIDDQNCRVPEVVGERSGKLQYNAVLLLTDTGIAALHLPNLFVQSGNAWEMQKLDADDQMLHSISVRMIVDASKTASGSATKAQAAMISATQAMLSANFQLGVLADAMSNLSERLNKVETLVKDSALAKIKQAYEELMQKYSKLETSITDAQLLELFVEAKKSQGKLELTVIHNNVNQANAVLTAPVNVRTQIGQIEVGEQLPAGMSITEILQRLLG